MYIYIHLHIHSMFHVHVQCTRVYVCVVIHVKLVISEVTVTETCSMRSHRRRSRWQRPNLEGALGSVNWLPCTHPWETFSLSCLLNSEYLSVECGVCPTPPPPPTSQLIPPHLQPFISSLIEKKRGTTVNMHVVNHHIHTLYLNVLQVHYRYMCMYMYTVHACACACTLTVVRN